MSVFEKHGVSIAYLFGSRARGTAGPLSDTDIAVVFERGLSVNDRFERRLSVARELETVIRDGEVDVVDLESVTSPVLKFIATREGELLMCNDDERRVMLESKIFHEHEDTAYLRRVQQEIMRKHLQAGTFGKVSVQ